MSFEKKSSPFTDISTTSELNFYLDSLKDWVKYAENDMRELSRDLDKCTYFITQIQKELSKQVSHV